MDEKDLSFSRQLLLDGALDQALLEWRDNGLDGQAVFRRSLDHGHVAKPGKRHVQRSGNRRGGKRQSIHVFLQFFQALLVRYTEALLFIYEQQA